MSIQHKKNGQMEKKKLPSEGQPNACFNTSAFKPETGGNKLIPPGNLKRIHYN